MYDYEIRHEYGHYAVYVNGKLYCTADNYKEAEAEVSTLYGGVSA